MENAVETLNGHGAVEDAVKLLKTGGLPALARPPFPSDGGDLRQFGAGRPNETLVNRRISRIVRNVIEPASKKNQRLIHGSENVQNPECKPQVSEQQS